MNLPPLVLAVVTAVGWTLISFLWQALLVHGSLALFLRLVPVRRSQLRYALGLVALLALVLAPALTFSRFLADPAPQPMTFTGMLQVPQPVVTEPGTTVANTVATGLPGQLVSLAALGWPVNIQVLMGYLSRYLPLVVIAWLLGVGLSVVRLAGDVAAVRRLRREGLRPAPPWLVELVAKHSDYRSGEAPILVSELVTVPIVVGVIKPLILVPASVFSGLTPRQLELIIVHELTHIRRFDPVVNQVQCVIEALFFFHPSVASINRMTRQEREHRTDSEVARVSGGALEYATALGTLAQVASVPGSYLAATGGNLSSRVRRVLGMPERPVQRLGAAIGMAGIGLLLVVGAALAAPGPGDLAGQIIANPAIVESLSQADLEQLMRQTASSDVEDEEKRLSLLVILAERASREPTLTALYILNADTLSPVYRQSAREALFAAQREAAQRDDPTGPVETYEIPHNVEANYVPQGTWINLILGAGFDLGRASLAGRDASEMPTGRSMLYVKTLNLPDSGLDRTRLLERLDLSDLPGLNGLEPASFGVLLTKWPGALRGANRFSNPDFTLEELLAQSDPSPLDGPWSLWVDDGNVVTANTTFEDMSPVGRGVVAPTPAQFLCLDDGVVVGGVRSAWTLAADGRFDQIRSDCLSGRWGSEWNPVLPAPGQVLPPFELVSESGETLDSTELNGQPVLFAFLGPVEEPPIVMEVGLLRTSDAPEPAPGVRVQQLEHLIDDAGSDASVVVVAVPYSRAGVDWTAAEVADALREQLDVPVFTDPSETLWLDFHLFGIGAGDVMLVDDGRFVEIFRDLNTLEMTMEGVESTLKDALERLSSAVH